MSSFIINEAISSRWSRDASEAEIFRKASGIQRKILSASSHQSGRPTKMREVRQSNGGFEAWTLFRVQEDSGKMGVGNFYILPSFSFTHLRLRIGKPEIDRHMHTQTRDHVPREAA
jgi:hypothetical protein